VLARKDGRALGVPKLRGFGQRWLRAAAEPGSQPPTESENGAPTARASRAAIAADVAGLAMLAEHLLTPPDLRNTSGGRSFGTAPAVTMVITAALDQEADAAYGSVLALVAALTSAVAADSVCDPTGGIAFEAPRSPSRSRWLVASVAALVVVGGIQLMRTYRHHPAIPSAAPAEPIIVLAALPAPTPQPVLAVARERRVVPIEATRVEPQLRRAARAPRRDVEDGRTLRESVWSDKEQRVVFVNVGESVE
jgi:hypothetical protein